MPFTSRDASRSPQHGGVGAWAITAFPSRPDEMRVTPAMPAGTVTCP